MGRHGDVGDLDRKQRRLGYWIVRERDHEAPRRQRQSRWLRLFARARLAEKDQHRQPSRPIASNHGGDPTRLGVMGRGAGAGLAMMITLDRRYMAAVDQPNLIRAAAGLAGVYGVGQTTDPTWTQPIAYVRPNAPPIWLGYDADGDTPAVVDAVTLDQRIRAVGGRSAVYVRSGSAPMSSVLEDAAKFFHSALR